MPLDTADVQQFKEATERVDRIMRALPGVASGNSQANISINAGGMGLWIAITSCVAMLAMNVILVVILIDHGRKIDDLNDYLTAVYMMAPHLKPPEKKTK